MKNLHNISKNYMITIGIIVVFIFGTLVDLYSQKDYKSIVIELSVNNFDAKNFSVNPGDTILLKAGLRRSLRIVNLHGDSSNYITIKNFEGEVIVSNDNYNYGISISNCSFIRLTGTGDSTSTYGIKIINTPKGASGLSLSNLSTNYEIDHLEISNTGFAGIFAKTDPTFDGLSNRGNFIQYDTKIHNNYIHHTAGEGVYLGHSFYTGIKKVINGDSITLYPHELKGVRVYNNTLDNNGYDGLQIGCATEDCEIYNNQITNYGVGNVDWQKSGIQISGGTTGKCYNNTIIKGTGTGIGVFGLGYNSIYNNVIVDAGNLNTNNDPKNIAYGIFCDDRSTIPGSYFHFINNTIISPLTDGIRIYSNLSKNNKFINNIIYNPGSYGKYSNINKSYIYYNSDVQLEISNNLFKSDKNPAYNLETLNDILEFSYTLPINKKGQDVTSLGITYDYFNNSRENTNKPDIGAFEINDELFKVIEEKNNFSLYPNPCKGDFFISNSQNEPIRKITIKTLSGSTVYEEVQNLLTTKPTNLKNVLKPGNYFACIQTNNSSSTLKLIIQ